MADAKRNEGESMTHSMTLIERLARSYQFMKDKILRLEEQFVNRNYEISSNNDVLEAQIEPIANPLTNVNDNSVCDRRDTENISDKAMIKIFAEHLPKMKDAYGRLNLAVDEQKRIIEKQQKLLHERRPADPGCDSAAHKVPIPVTANRPVEHASNVVEPCASPDLFDEFDDIKSPLPSQMSNVTAYQVNKRPADPDDNVPLPVTANRTYDVQSDDSDEDCQRFNRKSTVDRQLDKNFLFLQVDISNNL
ncbi:uncharacterized protein LOC119079317 [Bradysia coprophila]|uniref:uncharacterized protein LOC119079317 n=1 Tax=Bradysia coprophila TaxID=38358 RepID=UPI00187D9AE0|nr:uncharacterized protein LOC119079317 [Bradysia coprophila]